MIDYKMPIDGNPIRDIPRLMALCEAGFDDLQLMHEFETDIHTIHETMRYYGIKVNTKKRRRRW